MKRITALFVMVCMFLISMPAIDVQAENTLCMTYSGNNVNAQNYSISASPIKSYLTICDDGTFMKFQYVAEDMDYSVEYYNTSYHLLNRKTIHTELPIFGAFYATEDYYFLITGQENPKEKKKVEVVRITKYDKDWNKIESVGLYDANTTVPFRSGCVRIDDYENYLLIRTSHLMYASSDGRNHQANMTIQVDTDTMKITESVDGIRNVMDGYVSHSFNQFIKIEDGKIVALDHGDGYPRAVVLIKYDTPISTGSFLSICDSTNLLEIPGTLGGNTTGVSVGGFEISDTSYLAAGNKVDLEHLEEKPGGVRNIFIASMTKSEDTVAVNQLTNYESGFTSTPHLVKVDNDNFILLWRRQEIRQPTKTIYYTKIDGSGNQVGKIYEMEGSLSDCVPLIANEKLIWYTWEDDTISFYEINTKDLSDNNQVIVKNGHIFECSRIKKHIASLVCTRCGEKRQVDTPTAFNVSWEIANEYRSTYPDFIEVDKNIGCWINAKIEGTLEYQDSEFIFSCSDNTAMKIIPPDYYGPTNYISFVKPGTYTLTIQHKYDTSLSQKYTFNITPKGPDEVSLNKKNLTLGIGEKYKLKPSLTPKDATSTYTWKSSNKKIVTVTKNGWVKAVGIGTAKVTVTTKNGKKAVCKVTVK